MAAEESGLRSEPDKAPRRRSLVRRLFRSKSAVVGMLITLSLVAVSAGAPLFTSTDPTAMDPMMILKAPGPGHPMGTDDFGRDLFARVLYGGRISLLVAMVVALMTTVTGVLIGTVAGFYPRVDNLIMRVMDLLMAFPPILLAIGILAVAGPRLSNIIIALVVPYTPRSAMVVRGQVLAMRQSDFVEAARSLGMRDLRIMLRHLVPNAIAPLLVQQTFVVALAVLAESGLNFLGVGVPPDVPTLGSILNDSRTHLRTAPWMSLYPGAYISLLVLGFNLLGDGLRDVFDPRMKL